MTSGEIWQVDLGMAGKVRPALLLTSYPEDDALSLITILPHTTALRGNPWEVSIAKSFLQPGAFHLQQVQSIPTARLLRRLGSLTGPEMEMIRARLREYLDI